MEYSMQSEEKELAPYPFAVELAGLLEDRGKMRHEALAVVAQIAAQPTNKGTTGGERGTQERESATIGKQPAAMSAGRTGHGTQQVSSQDQKGRSQAAA